MLCRRESADGTQGRGALLGQRVHLCVSGAELRAEGNRSGRRLGALLHSVWHQSVHHRGGGGLHGSEVCRQSVPSERDVPPLGNGAARHRHQNYKMVSALITSQKSRFMNDSICPIKSPVAISNSLSNLCQFCPLAFGI